MGGPGLGGIRELPEHAADGFCMKDFYATESAFLGVCFTYNLPSLYQHASAKDRAKKLFAAMDRTSGITAAKRLTRADANAR